MDERVYSLFTFERLIILMNDKSINNQSLTLSISITLNISVEDLDPVEVEIMKILIENFLFLSSNCLFSGTQSKVYRDLISVATGF